MLSVINATLQQHFILTWRGFVCVGEAAAPVIAVIEPSPSTNDVNSFARPCQRLWDGSGDCCPLLMIGGQRTCWANKGQWWRAYSELALAVGRVTAAEWADSKAHHGFDVFARMAISALAGQDRPKGQIWQCRAFLMVCPQCPTLAELPYIVNLEDWVLKTNH
jgi:hypothetical protein